MNRVSTSSKNAVGLMTRLHFNGFVFSLGGN